MYMFGRRNKSLDQSLGWNWSVQKP